MYACSVYTQPNVHELFFFVTNTFLFTAAIPINVSMTVDDKYMVSISWTMPTDMTSNDYSYFVDVLTFNNGNQYFKNIGKF